jgi:hypothetical protein
MIRQKIVTNHKLAVFYLHGNPGVMEIDFTAKNWAVVKNLLKGY